MNVNIRLSKSPVIHNDYISDYTFTQMRKLLKNDQNENFSQHIFVIIVLKKPTKSGITFRSSQSAVFLKIEHLKS